MQGKDHSIIESPWKYKIVGFNFQQNLQNKFEPYIDLTLQKDEEVRRLRFLSPKIIELKSFPETYGLCILDVSDRGMECKVEVTDFEEGRIHFFSRKVIDLDKITEVELEILQVEYEYNLR